MPHGYKCDRCDDFVEQHDFTTEHHTDLGGEPVEVVRVHNPFLQSDGGGPGGDVETYTLCDECRRVLVGDFVGRSS